MNTIYDYTSQAAIVAAITVATVEGVRKRVPAIDGWWVILVSMIVSTSITMLVMHPTTVSGACESGTVALLAVCIAVGGDSWIAKMVKR